MNKVSLFLILLLNLMKKLINNKSERIEFLFGFWIIVMGFEVLYESLWYESYRFHEVYLIHYTLYIVISICSWLKWKRMIFMFVFVQIWSFIATILAYNEWMMIEAQLKIWRMKSGKPCLTCSRVFPQFRKILDFDKEPDAYCQCWLSSTYPDLTGRYGRFYGPNTGRDFPGSKLLLHLPFRHWS